MALVCMMAQNNKRTVAAADVAMETTADQGEDGQ